MRKEKKALPYFLKRSGYGKKMGWQKDVPLKHALILRPMEPRFAQQNYQYGGTQAPANAGVFHFQN
jgi:hypothetical protein